MSFPYENGDIVQFPERAPGMYFRVSDKKPNGECTLIPVPENQAKQELEESRRLSHLCGGETLEEYINRFERRMQGWASV